MRSIITLFLVCIVSSSLLSSVNMLTKERIESINSKNTKESIETMFSEIKNFNIVSSKKDSLDVYELYDKDSNEFLGASILSFSEKGYGGRIDILVSIKDCNVVDYKILKDSETPGLGSKAKEEEFISQFKGKNLNNCVWKVKKDGGDIGGITSATITSRAVVSSIEKALQIYSKNYGGCSNVK